MIINIDIETMPEQGGYEAFLAAAKADFNPPSTLTKGQACTDLGLTGNDAKFTSKDDAIAQWVAKFAEEKAPEVAEYEWRRTALDGGKGEIFSIAIAVEDQEPVCFSRSLNDGAFSSEADMLEEFMMETDMACGGRPPFFVGQFVAGFDLKFIFHRCVINRVRPAFKLPFDGRHEQHYYDTQIGWAGFKGRMSQDNLCKALGIEGKPHDIDGSKVWDFLKAGKLDEVVAYNIDDVTKNREIYKRLNFITQIKSDLK